MKKSYILLSTLLASLLALAGCDKPNPSTGGQEESPTPSNSEVSTPSTGGQEESSSPSEEQSTTLAAPVVTVSEEGLASWEAVANATGYIYKLNGKEIHLHFQLIAIRMRRERSGVWNPLSPRF